MWVLIAALLVVQAPSVFAQDSSNDDNPAIGVLVCERPDAKRSTGQEKCEETAVHESATRISVCQRPDTTRQKKSQKSEQDAVHDLVKALLTGGGNQDYQKPLRDLRNLTPPKRFPECLFQVKPIDKQDSMRCEADECDGIPNLGETPLTAAVRSGQRDRVQDVIDAVRLQGGEIDARNAKNCTGLQTADFLLKNSPEEEIKKAYRAIERLLIKANAACDPGVYGELCQKPRSVLDFIRADTATTEADSASNAPATSHNLIDLISFHAASITVPDAQNAPVGAPKYITDLINQGQGASVSAKGTNGTWGPTIAGDMRLNLYAGDRISYGSDDFGSLRVFTDIAGDLNKNDVAKSVKTGQALLPNWASVGIGATQAASRAALPVLGDSTPNWFTLVERVSRLENRLYAEELLYWVETASGTAVIPATWPDFLAKALPEWTPLRRLPDGTSPAYLTLTAGTQFQQQSGSGTPSPSELPKGTTYSVAPNYAVYRSDLYAYPCGLQAELTRFCATVLDKAPGSSVIVSNQVSIHVDYEKVPRVGHFFEWSINVPLVKYGVFSITHSVGIQDPLASFGVVPYPPRATVTSLQFKTKVN